MRLIFFAMPVEARPFLRRAGQAGVAFTREAMDATAPGAIRLRGPETEVWVTGMGPANARRVAANALERVRPAWVATCGVAGALDTALRVGDVRHEADPDFPPATHLPSHGSLPARMLMSDRLAVTAEDKRLLRERTSAALVDMESAAIREICREQGIPSATIRAVSDDAARDLPLDFNRLYTPSMRIDPARLAFRILAAPWKIPALVRFGRQTAFASGRLAGVLTGICRFDVRA